MAYFRSKDLIYGNYRTLSRQYKVISPKKFVYFSNEQLTQEKFRNGFSFSEETSFFWTKCKNIYSGDEVLIPSQLIYCPYIFKKEKTISFPVSTGAALGLSQEEAIYRGLCEVVERDAYMTTYLLRRHPLLIEFKNTTRLIRNIIVKFFKYRLNMKCFLIASDIDIPTVMTVITDSGNYSPPISIGLKTDWNLENAIIGSLEEAFQIRMWIRSSMLTDNFEGHSYTDKVVLNRAKFWIKHENLPLLDFILKTPNKKIVDKKDLLKYKNVTYNGRLSMIKRLLEKMNHDAYFKKTTYGPLKNMGIVVVKCIIPGLHPMHLDEDYPYLGGERLRKLRVKFLGELNTTPHPFF